MIIRSYLPYKSAREYVDRGMAKWMGFFISEHSTDLAQQDTVSHITVQMDIEELTLLLTQAYSYQLQIAIYTTSTYSPYIGTVHDIQETSFSFRTLEGFRLLQFHDILRMEVYNEELA